MPVLPRITSAFRSLFRNHQLERDLDEELQGYLEMLTEEKIRAGMNPEQARREALIELGGVDQIKEKVRDIRIGAVVEAFWKDARYALRILLKKPGFVIVAVLTLALGIGATTTLFSVVNAVVLRPLPFREPEKLVRLYEVTPQGNLYTTSEPTYLSWREMSNHFEDIGAYDGLYSLDLSGEGEPEAISGSSVSHSLLPLLGIGLIIGRGFTPEEDRPGESSRVVILSDAFWESHYGSDPGILGRMLTLNNDSYTVIGVARLRGTLRFDGDVVIPLAADPNASRSNHYITAVGRLAPGVTLEVAQAGMTAIAGELSDAFPESNGGWGALLTPIDHWLVATDTRRTVFVLLGTVGLLLLLACANVSNLLVARGTTRLKEIGLRAALGASRGRIIRQLLTESIVLAGLGAVVGLVLTAWALPFIRSISPANIPRIDEISIDGAVLLFTLLATVLSSLVFGLMPSLQVSRQELNETLKEATPTAFSSGRVRNVLVVGELALATIVLIAAGLMARSFIRLQAVDTGFEPQNAVSVRLQLSSASSAQERQTFFRMVEERIAALPGVTGTGSSFLDLFSGSHTSNRVSSPDLDPQSPDDFLPIEWRTVTPGFFRAMQIPLLIGRTFNDLDGSAEDGYEYLPVIVGESLAERLWPGENPLDKRVLWSRIGGSQFIVIGVVSDVLDYRIDVTPRPTLYIPFNAQTWQAMTVVVRTAIDPSGLTDSIRREIRSLNPGIVIPEIRPLADTIIEARGPYLFTIRLFSFFALLALAMAAMGVYAIIVYQVAQRAREIGIRMALGADSGRILRMVLHQSLIRIIIGLVIGLGAALALTRLMASLLYETVPTDPITYVIVLTVLAMAAVAATIVPSIRATRIDPKVAIIAE